MSRFASRPRRIFRRIVAAIAVLGLAACSSAPLRPETFAQGDYRYTIEHARWQIGQEMDENQITGLSIALIDDQRVVWAEGFGFEDAVGGIPATTATPYRLGSIAKVMTATAAMQLAEAGRLDIDHPLAEALPGFSVRSRFTGSAPITPRNIMTHHSGLPLNYLNGMFGYGKTEPFAGLVGAVKNSYVSYPPEFVFAYSNLGFALLGTAIENTAGEPYAHHVEQHLFVPLGMVASRFESRPEVKVYDHGREIEPLALRDLPAGGLVSTVEDMSRFMHWMFADGRLADGRQLLGADLLGEMLRPQNGHVALDLGMKTGLGWQLSGIDIHGAGTVASHGGTMLDSHSLMIVLPEHKLGVIVAANSATGQGAVKTVAARTLALALEAKTGIRQPAPVTPPVVADAALPAEQLGHYKAWYDSLIGLVHVSPTRSALDAEVMGHTLQLRPRGAGEFGLRYKLFGLIPVQVASFDNIRISTRKIAGREVLVGHFGADTMLVGERLNPAPIPPALLDFVGEYEIVNEGMGITPEMIAVSIEDGMLVGNTRFAQLPGFVLRIGLTPISSTELLVSGLGTGKGETIALSVEQGEQVLRFSGLELRKKKRHLAAVVEK
ncbi:hypothetical protein FACS1894154_08390 [Betaproteobacteria bacterium]|nr:hypothetical protein FACS1894154_08390 [Betaproteobacteria bacterium]GHU25879.1 hypothetical protein FACS189488_13640 [Betaproteobacteria bacterium]